MNEEKTEQSPWDSLIGELGVEVQPESLERHQPAAQQLPTVSQERAEVTPPQAAPSDWMGLASSLGLEVPPEEPPRKPETAVQKHAEPERQERPREERRRERPREERPREERPREPRAQEERHREERGRDDRQRGGRRGHEKRGRDRGREPRQEEAAEIQDEIEFEEVDEVIDEGTVTEIDEVEEIKEPDKPRISGEAARSAFDALFSAESVNWGSAFVSPRTNVESSFLFTEGEEAVFAEDIPDKPDIDDDDDEDGEEPKKRPRRRRRGGRGRGRSRKPEREETAEDETDEDSIVEGEEIYESLSQKVEPAEGVEAEGEDRSEKRRRRRRPRGRGRKPEEVESASEEEDTNVLRRIATHVDGGDEGDDEEEVDSGDEARGGHRNLPTWNDAIGVIVESNLSQRSKAPAKQQGPPRGGRGRGGRRHKK